MLFSSSSELLIVSIFLIIQLLFRTYLSKTFNKTTLLVGNILILSTVISTYTIGLHITLGILIYFSGKFISRNKGSRAKVFSAITILLVILGFALRSFPKAFGIESFQLNSDPSSIIQRLGISYIMFRHIQFIVDSYKQKINSFNLIDYINFLLFFPNFLAGPIDVYNNFTRWSNKENGKLKKALILPGLGRILIGFIKKYFLVPFIYAYAVSYEPLAESMGQTPGILMSLVVYSVYIYLDFSGYSDIAIGSGYIMGIRTPENFNSPYLTTNIADFWRRWHITFSDFLRELIFKPIVKGISSWRIKPPRLIISIIGYILTFFICGIWHGDTVNFVYWGLWHGVGLAVYKAWSLSTLHTKLHSASDKKFYSILITTSGFLITFSFVSFGWMFFHYSGSDLTLVFDLLFK